MLVATIKIKYATIQRILPNKAALLSYIEELTLSGVDVLSYAYTFGV